MEKKSVKFNKKEFRNLLKKFHEHGIECGKEIGKILRKRHPKGMILPLYRSVAVIEYIAEVPRIKLTMYGDPHAMGEEINKSTLHGTEYYIRGERFEPNITDSRGEYARFPMKGLKPPCINCPTELEKTWGIKKR